LELSHMNNLRRAVACGAAAALLGIGTTAGGLGSAAAQPNDYSTLPVDPNVVTDSLAYNAAPPVFDPSGQPGVTAVYTHRGGERQITNILVLSDAQAATAAVGGAAVGKVANGQTQPAAVGSGGTIVSGMSPDGTKSVTVLTFTQGNAAATIESDGPPEIPHRPTSSWSSARSRTLRSRIGKPPRAVCRGPASDHQLS
jgi:hypothetical protein